MDNNISKVAKMASSGKTEKHTYVVSTLFNARTNAHIAHLQTKSYARHMALNDFYEGVIDIADKFAEASQASGVLLKGYTLGELCVGDIVPFLEKQYNDLLGCKKDFTEGHLLQLIDDATELYATTLYKLKTFA